MTVRAQPLDNTRKEGIRKRVPSFLCDSSATRRTRERARPAAARPCTPIHRMLPGCSARSHRRGAHRWQRSGGLVDDAGVVRRPLPRCRSPSRRRRSCRRCRPPRCRATAHLGWAGWRPPHRRPCGLRSATVTVQPSLCSSLNDGPNSQPDGHSTAAWATAGETARPKATIEVARSARDVG